jgi:TM2 domain-containing membrane protein YozV
MTEVPVPPDPASVPAYNQVDVHNKRVMAGILGIVAGSFGVHRFYLGDTKGGIIRLVLCCLPIGVIEGIMYLTKTDEAFYQEYLVQKKAWF